MRLRYNGGCVYLGEAGIKVWNLLLYLVVLVALLASFASRYHVHQIEKQVRCQQAVLEHRADAPAPRSCRR